MSAPQPGWYPDPIDGRRWRWWDGAVWTDRIGENGRQRLSPLPSSRAKRRVPVWAWIVVGLILLPVLIALSPIVGMVAVVVVVTGVVALAARSRTWLRFRSRKSAAVVTAVATVILLATGGVTALAATSARPTVDIAEPAPFVRPVDGAGLAPTTGASSPVGAPTPSKTPSTSSSPKPTRTAAPAPTPVVRVVEVSVAAAVPYGRTSVDDGTMPRGQSRIDVAGVDGEKTSVFRVTTVDGLETQRSLIRESVTREPVSEVTAVGTYDPPAPVAQVPSSGGCHPSYADACVPIDSDVDCAGGSGNGPSYFDGVARVVGPDEYDLDRDGDGFACNG